MRSNQGYSETCMVLEEETTALIVTSYLLKTHNFTNKLLGTGQSVRVSPMVYFNCSNSCQSTDTLKKLIAT